MARIETDCDIDLKKKKASGCQFLESSSLARKSLKFYKNVFCSLGFAGKLLPVSKWRQFNSP